ncbi:TonB-dependent receptor [Lentisalinibacter salinarum]|uniref:TonB-dependent receptor n=1 Tax=Lentisalinibacter salinarum TaxID=2992239 RepID=UPI003866A268
MSSFRIGPGLLACLAMTAATAIPESAAAQSGNDAGEGVIEEIVVSASRVEQPATAIPGTLTILDAETIELQSAISDDLASVLSNSVPGFAPSSQKLMGRSETLRGRNPLYLIDGVPQHNALRDGQRDGHTIDLAFIERIEVINGSNSIQGVGATGGVVNTVTRAPVSADSWQTDLEARLTTADDFDSDAYGYKIAASTGRGTDAFDFIVGFAYHDRGLFLDADGDAVGLYPTQGDIMDSTSLGLFGKGEWRVTGDATLTLLVNDFELERNGDFRSVPGDRSAGIPTGTEEGDPSAEVGDPARNEVTTVSLTWRQERVLGGSLEAQVYDQSYAALFEGGTFGGFFRLTPDGEPFLDQSEIVSDKNGLKTTWNRALVDPDLNLTAGIDWFRDDSAQELARSGREWVPETRFETVSPFVQLGWTINEVVTVTGGARQENASLEVDDYTTIASAGSTFVEGGEPEFDETLFNAGAIWRLTDSWTLYAAAAEAFTMPDVGRVLRGVSTPGLDVDSLLEVEPVVTDNTEFGVEYGDGRVTARATYYESTADNGSRLLSNEAGIFEVQRQRTEIDGVELSLDYAVSESLSLGANYSRIDGRFDSDGDGSVDSDLDGLNIGPDRLNLYVEGRVRDDIRWRVQAARLEDRSFDGPGAPADAADFDGYTLADAFVSWRSDYGVFSVAVENLLNEDYFTYFAQTEPFQRSDTYFAGKGRTLTFGWQRAF